MHLLLPLLLVLGGVLAACGGGSDPAAAFTQLPEVRLDELVAELEASEQPTVINLWASWCIPCRSEAPLLREAEARFGDRVRFLGVATEDSMQDSVAFLAEFDLTFENVSDPQGLVKGWAGAPGLPTTLFVLPGGEVLRTHYGVIDDQALALGIDDLLAG